MGKRGIKPIFVRVEYDAGGTPHAVGNGDGKEIFGLRFDKCTLSYNRRVDGRKENLGRDLVRAIERVTDARNEPARIVIKVKLPKPTSHLMKRCGKDAELKGWN